MISINSLIHSIWQVMVNYVFYYPLFMSCLWIIGAIFFYFKHEKSFANQMIPELSVNDSWPGVSILIPCRNESQNAVETIYYALNVEYPTFEIIAINDGSEDDTLEILHALAKDNPKLKVINLMKNQGKALGLQAGALVAKYEYLVCIDGDALIDKHCLYWMVKHFIRLPDVAAVTGNPRIRNRSSLLGKIQVGEFSSIVGLIKRAQRTFGRLFTVSGVITAFRKSAVHEVGYWSPDMLTEDIDITWKLQRNGWNVLFEPKSLAWILMPETLKGLWNQRLRWAMGGVQVMLKNIKVLFSTEQTHLWGLMVELILSMIWAYSMIVVFFVWGINVLFSISNLAIVHSTNLPDQSGLILTSACLLQFAVSRWIDGHYDQGLGKNYFWLIWYPFIYWLLNLLTATAALPKVLLRKKRRARWVSPDRGVHQKHKHDANLIISNNLEKLRENKNSLIINDRHALPLSKKLPWDIATIILWSGWLYLWKPILVIIYNVFMSNLTAEKTSISISKHIDIQSLEHNAFLLIATLTVLYILSRTHQNVPSKDSVTYEPKDYTNYFHLKTTSLQQCKNSQFIDVYHDNEGHIINLNYSNQ